jgi:3-hydroxy-9,10-secoandrosta-1,3,5(10)-triene-9,17-dione monooxygenase
MDSPALTDVRTRVAALSDRWRDRAPAAERARRLPDDTVAELFDSGLMTLAAPTRHGGAGLGWPAVVEAARLAARACPSTGWVLGVVGGHAAMAGRLPRGVGDLLFADRPQRVHATASATPDGRIVRGGDGFTVTGRWRFCSAVEHSAWIILNGLCEPDLSNGERVLLPIPVADVRVEDGWHVSGMAATGSRDIVLDEVFVPGDRADSLRRCFAAHWSPDTAPADYLGQVPFRNYMNSFIIGPLLGCAEAAVDAFAATARPAHRDGLTESAAELTCARLLYESLCSTLHSAGLGRRALTTVEAATVERDRAYLAQLCVRAVHRLVRLAGTAAHFDDNLIARHWRDLQMMAAHRDVDWARNSHAYSTLPLAGDRP